MSKKRYKDIVANTNLLWTGLGLFCKGNFVHIKSLLTSHSLYYGANPLTHAHAYTSLCL